MTDKKNKCKAICLGSFITSFLLFILIGVAPKASILSGLFIILCLVSLIVSVVYLVKFLICVKKSKTGSRHLDRKGESFENTGDASPGIQNDTVQPTAQNNPESNPNKGTLNEVNEKPFRFEDIMPVGCTQADNLICLDCETTGLSAANDEILQLSIINGHGEVLFNAYFKPTCHSSWAQAEKTNHITPEFLKDKEYFFRYKEKISDIISGAEQIIGYNVAFDLAFLKNAGIIPPQDTRVIDVMNLYQDYLAKNNNNGSRRLQACASHFGFTEEDGFHNSLYDAKATLFCFYKLSIPDVQNMNDKTNRRICIKKEGTEESIYDSIDEIEINGKHFCLTGIFTICPRQQVINLIIENGGIIDQSLLKKTDYLIVGNEANANWKYGNYGTKIEKAITSKNSNGIIRIINEELFMDLVRKK